MSESQSREVLERALRLVGDWCGLIRQVVVHEVGPPDPPLFFATARLGSTRGFSDVQAGLLNGGAGSDVATAVMGAIGEAIERYSIGLYREADLVRGTFVELGAEALDPRRLIFFSDEQYDWKGFPYARFDPKRPLSWVPGVSLIDGRQRLVPAVRVFTPYVAPCRSELLMQSTSTGAACQTSRELAVLNALYECIERDAFVIAWLNRLPLPEMAAGGLLGQRDLGLLHALERRGIVPRWFDATTDLLCPTVVCVLEGSGEGVPSQAFGAATKPTLRAAARKALIESAHTWFWIRTRLLDASLELPRRADFADVTSLNAHSLLYAAPRMREHTRFLLGDVPIPVGVRQSQPQGGRGDAKHELAHWVGVLANAGLEAVAVDLTPPEIADLGFEVFRVVVSDLQPLWGGHHVRCLGGDRVRKVPVALGYRERESTTVELNSAPHPMP